MIIEETYKFIELLWIIPIIGFGVFISILVFLLHNKYSKEADSDLKREVTAFNAGIHHISASPQGSTAAGQLEKRLSELEGAIASLTQSIAVHQKSMAGINTVGATDNTELNTMLEAMRREYDAILHENRTLRSQFMKFLSEEGKTPKVPHVKSDMKVFDDTRSLSVGDFDDTSVLIF